MKLWITDDQKMLKTAQIIHYGPYYRDSNSVKLVDRKGR